MVTDWRGGEITRMLFEKDTAEAGRSLELSQGNFPVRNQAQKLCPAVAHSSRALGNGLALICIFRQ